MQALPFPLDVEGPVQAEVFVVWLDGATVSLTGPDGPAPWLLEVGAGEHPVEAVRRTVDDVLGPPILVHSTSWRRDRDAVILSFVAVVAPAAVASLASKPVPRAELARSGASAAPAVIAHEAVLEHALRHLSWLAVDDPVVRAELSADWRDALAGFVPEPFRALG